MDNMPMTEEFDTIAPHGDGEMLEGDTVALRQSVAAQSRLSAKRLVAALRLYRQNLEVLTDWIDSSWIEGLLNCNADQLSSLTRALERASVSARHSFSSVMANAAGVKVPSLFELGQGTFLKVEVPSARGVSSIHTRWPNVVLLDVLPVSRAKEVLIARALLFRRTQMLKIIDREQLCELSARWKIDLPTLKMCFSEPSSFEERSVIREFASELDALNAQQLVLEGWWLLQRDVGRRAIGFAREHSAASEAQERGRLLLELALPQPHKDAWLSEIPANADINGSFHLFARLPDIIPEFSWLFG